MLHLRIAFQFLKKSFIRTLSILLVVTVGIGVLFFLLSLGDMLNNMILDQTTLYQEHIILYEEEKIKVENLNYDLIDEIIERVPNVNKGFAKTQIPGIISSPNMTRPTTTFLLVAVSNHNNNSSYQDFYGINIEDHIIDGKVNDSSKNELMLDDYFAKQNNISVGDIITFNNIYHFEVTGTFDLGLFKDSRAYAFIPIELLNLQNEVEITYVFQTNNPLKTKRDIRKIKRIDDSFTFKDWKAENPIVEVLNSAQRTVVIIINVMIAVGIFAIVLSLLNFFIKQKYKQIGFLKAMGLTNKDINLIFILQSSLLTLISSIIGLIAGTIAMVLYASFMTYPDGTPRFSYNLLWYNYLLSLLLIFVTIILSTIVSIRRIKDLSIIELIKI